MLGTAVRSIFTAPGPDEMPCIQRCRQLQRLALIAGHRLETALMELVQQKVFLLKLLLLLYSFIIYSLVCVVFLFFRHSAIT